MVTAEAIRPVGSAATPAAGRARASGRGRVPWGLVGMALLVLAVERGLADREMDLMAPWHWDWRLAGKAARGEARRAEVLCLGDSLLKFGVQPVVLERRLGRRAYSLALCLGQAPSGYFLLRRALDAGARPALLLVHFSPHLLATGPREGLRQWPELLSWRESLDLARTAHDPDLFASIALGRLLRSARSRAEIRSDVGAALRGESALRRHKSPAYLRNLRVNRGGLVMPALPARGDPAAIARSLFSGWRCDPTNRAYLDRLLALAASRGIPVCWVLPPIGPEVQAESDRLGFDARWSRFLADVLGRPPGATVLDARHSRYAPTAQTDDRLHLGRSGAQTLSADVADALARLGGDPARRPRWIDLPEYRERPEAGPLEDTHESAARLAGGRGAARR